MGYAQDCWPFDPESASIPNLPRSFAGRVRGNTVPTMGKMAVQRRMVHSDDFLLAGRSIAAWTAGLAFLSANLGAQEMIGMAASGAKYGILTSHFYWVGAIPAMVFVGIFMMPFYYGSRARSV